MKFLGLLFIAFACVCGAYAKLSCNTESKKVEEAQWDMVESCTDLLRKQVKMEMEAAMTYLAMGAHFSEDRINRPGFSKFFFEAASEEREHAIKVIEYLLMRGQLTSGAGALLPFPVKNITVDWADGLTALQQALKLEISVTKSIRHIIATCEGDESSKDREVAKAAAPAAEGSAKPANSHKKANKGHKFNDYHLVDYFTSDFLDEQYRGERDLAGKISTLLKMTGTDNPDKSLGEFLFDKKLLNGEV